MRALTLPFLSALSLLVVTACGWDSYQPAVTNGSGAGGSATGGSGGEASGGAGAVGGEGGGGGMEPAPCGTVDGLAESFDMPTNVQIWSTYASSSGSGTLTTGSGSLGLSLGGTSGYGTAHLTSRHQRDMRGSSVAFEVSTVTLSNPHWGLIWIGPDDNNSVRFIYQNGQLRPGYELAGSGHDLASLPYSATEHRWWRIREEAGTVYWEVSPDNATYTVVAERPVSGLFPFDNVITRIRVYSNGTVPVPPQTMTVDTIAVDGPGSGGWCSVSSLSDDFEDGFRSPDWLFTGGTSGAGAVETDGQVRFTVLEQMLSDYQLISSKNYDLSSSEISVELVERGAATTSFLQLTRVGQEISLQVLDVDDGMANITTEIQAVTNIDGDIQLRGSQPYNPDVHRFLRIRHDGVGLVWETSADGVAWPDSPADERHIATVSPTPSELIITDMDVRVGAKVDAVDAPGQSVFDNLNVLPTE